MVAVLAVTLLAGCGAGHRSAPAATSATSASPTATPAPTTATPTTAMTAPATSAPNSMSPTSAAPTTARPSASATTPAVRVIDYEAGGRTAPVIDNAAAVSKLTGAPQDFKTFIAWQAGRTTSDCPDPVSYRVTRLAPSGWAAGVRFAEMCDGTPVLWATVDGGWRQVWSGQSVPSCRLLQKYRFPAAVADTKCATSSGGTVTYTG